MDNVRSFLASLPHDGPCVVVDLAAVEARHDTFRRALPDARIFYAVKANPGPEILAALAARGASFDCASVAEIRMALAAGATPDRVSFGNTIKKERDVAAAHALGVRLFAVDCEAEVLKVDRAAPGSAVFCRILCDGSGAEWPLSRKFGCEPAMAVDVLMLAAELGLHARGVSFHVGSQQTDLGAWDGAVASAAAVFRACAERDLELDLLNLGGGFPARYLRDVPLVEAYAASISASLREHFGDRLPETIIEPGRGMVGDAGILRAEVVLVSEKGDGGPRWVFLDVGKFGGLAETMDEAIRYRIETDRDGTSSPCVLAGPTCDSADVMYERNPYPLPDDLRVGDLVLIHGTGAYTTTYSAVSFNGFAPLAQFVV
jgi:ornithine decarboxylase